MSDPGFPIFDGTDGLEVWFPAPLAPHSQRLMDALGVVVHVDPPVPSTVTA